MFWSFPHPQRVSRKISFICEAIHVSSFFRNDTIEMVHIYQIEPPKMVASTILES